MTIRDTFCSQVMELEDVVAVDFSESLTAVVVLRDWSFDTQHVIYDIRRQIESRTGVCLDLIMIPLKGRNVEEVMV